VKDRQFFKSSLNQYGIPIASLVLAGVVLLIPLQLYYPLARYQHYGLAIFVWGVGYLVQLVWTWKSTRFWSRLSYLFLALYLTTLGLFFYANPWLDPRFSVQTEAQQNFRALVGNLYVGLALPVLLVSIIGFIDNLTRELAAGKKPQSPPK
jgi:hypothetical protein